MATKRLASIKGRSMRLTRLDECGDVVYGNCSSIITNGFIQIDIEEEVEEGEEITQKNAWGELCVSEVDDDITKWINVSINMCQVDPDVLDIIAAANPLVAATNTVGASFGKGPNTSAFALEVWTKAAGQDACAGGTTEYGYIAVPFCKKGRLGGGISIANNALTVPLQAKGFEVPASWGITPYGNNPLLVTGGFPSGDLWAIARTTVAPPAVTAGCVAITEP